MESRSLKWFLELLARKEGKLPILETGICKGERLLGYYYTDDSGTVRHNSNRMLKKTRHLVHQFLNTQVPMLQEYAPEKPVCYIYYKNGKKLLKAKEAFELAENQLHGLQVKSIHMVLETLKDKTLYRVEARTENGEILVEVFKSTSRKKEPVVEGSVGDKASKIALRIFELVYKLDEEFITKTSFEIVIDSYGNTYLVNIEHIDTTKKSNRKLKSLKTRVKFTQENESQKPKKLLSELTKWSILNLQNKKRKNDKSQFKIDFSNLIPKNNPNFIEVIAKTFRRQRTNSFTPITQTNEYQDLNQLINDIEKTRTQSKECHKLPKLEASSECFSPKKYSASICETTKTSTRSIRNPTQKRLSNGSIDPCQLTSTRFLAQSMNSRRNLARSSSIVLRKNFR